MILKRKKSFFFLFNNLILLKNNKKKEHFIGVKLRKFWQTSACVQISTSCTHFIYIKRKSCIFYEYRQFPLHLSHHLVTWCRLEIRLSLVYDKRFRIIRKISWEFAVLPHFLNILSSLFLFLCSITKTFFHLLSSSLSLFIFLGSLFS